MAVSFSDLQLAFEFVSSGGMGENGWGGKIFSESAPRRFAGRMIVEPAKK